MAQGKSNLDLILVADVSPRQVIGGGERVLWEESRALVRLGHRVRVLARDSGIYRLTFWRREGVEAVLVPAPRWPRDLPRVFWAMKRQMGRLRSERAPDLVVVHQPLAGLSILSQFEACPLLYIFHSPIAAEFQIRQGPRLGRLTPSLAHLLNRIEGKVLRRATAIRTLSHYMKQELLRHHPEVADQKIFTVPGGVDLDRFYPLASEARKQLRQSLGLDPRTPLLLTVRNLERRMGLEHLLNAFHQVAPLWPKAQLWIGGRGSLEGVLRQQVRTLGLEERVKFLGFVPEERLPKLYQVADWFILPTAKLEGFGLIILEALACGTPVLGTPVGAIPEILGKLDPRLLFSGSDPESIQKGLRWALGFWRSEAYQKLRAASCRFSEAFSWERSVQGWLGKVAPLCGAPTRSGI